MGGFGASEKTGVGDADRGITGDVNYAGTVLTVTWGKEHVQPLRFQGMDIGPFTMAVMVLDNETPLQAKRRAMVHLNVMAEEEAEEKMPRFIERCRKAEREASV